MTRSELSFRKDFQVLYEIIESYWRERDYSSILSKINSSDITNLRDEAKLQEFLKYKDALNIILPLLQNDGNLNNISTNNLSTLQAIADYNYGRATAKVRDLLEDHLNLSFAPIPEVNWYNPITFKADNRERKESNTGLRVFPNPAKDNLYLVLDNNNLSNQNYVFTMYDNVGKNLLKMENLNSYNNIDISNFISGIYHYTISINGEVVKLDKFIKTE